MKKSDLLLSMGFVCFISTFFILHLCIPDMSFSQYENRNLQSLPTFTWKDLRSGSYSEKLDNYATDQFPFRNLFVSLKASNEWFLGKLENNNVYWSKEGILIDRFHPVDYELLDYNLGKIIAFSETINIPLRFTIVPTQNDIYKFHLSGNTPLISQKEVLENMSQHPNYIDIYTPLLNHNREYIYYYSDHHWTSLGAYYAYETISPSMGLSPTSLFDYEEFILGEDFYGTTHSKASLPWAIGDTISAFVPNQSISYTNGDGTFSGNLYEPLADNIKNQYELFMAGNQPLVVIRNEDVKGERLLLIRDSYSNTLAPFFLEHYDEIHLIDLRTYKASMSEYIEEHNISQVLICYGISNFATDKNLTFLR